MKRYALSISLTLLAFMFAVPVHTAHANANTPVFEKTYEESFRYKMHGVDYDKTAVKNWYFDVKTGKIAFITDAKVEDILKSTGSKLNNGWGLVSYSPLVARGETYHADDKHTYYTPIYSFDDAGQMLAKKVFQSRSSEANFLSIAPDSFLVTYRLSEDGTYRTSKDYLDVVTPPGMESKTFEIKDPKIARAYGGTGDMLGRTSWFFQIRAAGKQVAFIYMICKRANRPFYSPARIFWEGLPLWLAILFQLSASAITSAICSLAYPAIRVAPPDGLPLLFMTWKKGNLFSRKSSGTGAFFLPDTF